MKELAKAYEAKQYETDIYRTWEESGYFNPDNLSSTGEPFTISMPPPNATGTLHLGHATMLAIQDLLVRYWRLRGRRTLWLPGTDHAAIATQNVVEKKIFQEEKKTRFDFGREEFVQRVSEFAEGSRGTIRSQVRAMGASCDWSRERYTLDKGLSQAVGGVFKQLYDDGLIYRGKRIVNWCTRCGTTLADDEVDYKESVGKLYFIKYGPVTVATTRPETKLGDTALAVHPDDERYQHLIGQEFEVALGKVKVRVKVIADKSIDQSFGTGVVGVTPAHSMADFELAQKNKLPLRIIIDQAGKMTAEAGEEYAGLKIKEARAKFIADLGPQVEKIEDYKHNLSICYRCGMPVEPMPLEQWFVAVDKPFKVGWFHKSTLKKLALKAVRSGQIRIVPDKFDKTYFQWMENLHDWCISRQIWFGHRIPAWRCLVCGGWHVTAQEPVKLILSRHGLTDWNEIGRIQGTTEVPLDESEIKQTEDIAKNFVADHPAIVITSPLMRARQTAAIFAEHLKCEVVEDDRIHERHYGVFEGKMVDDLVKDNPDYSEHKLSYPISGAETYAEVAARLKPFLADLAARYPGKTVVVVAHNAVLRTFRLLLDNMVDPELSHYRPALNEPLRREIVEPCACGSWALRQDEDTLDTWFSSSLWTFSTLGWPKQTKDLQNFHPTSVMETGYDILFFWVARMILMTSYVLKQVPFKTVYLHGLVRDKEGRKMSKSLGNGIDPLLMIEKYGADALRLAMIIGTTPGNDFRLYEEKISGYRNFVNKLWNIVRFALLSIANPRLVDQPPLAKTLADKWILSRFRTVADLVTAKVADFQFSEAGEALYDFTWHELADWYLEIAKLEGDKDDILCYLLTQLLKLWHPYTPFVTEVLWREAFGAAAGLLMVQPWPNQLSSKDDKAEEEFAQVRAVVTVLRNFRVERKVPSADVLSIALVKDSGVLQAQTKLIEGLRTKVKIMSQAEADWLEVKGLEQVSEHDLSIRIKF